MTGGRRDEGSVWRDEGREKWLELGGTREVSGGSSNKWTSKENKRGRKEEEEGEVGWELERVKKNISA